jgi:hypothetical protein
MALNFLESTFDSSQIRSILQSSRILRKNPKSKLEPTTSFLKQLYGSDLFHEAVSRNPDLLLISGLGYDSSTDNPLNPTFKELRLSKNDIVKLQGQHPFSFQIPISKIRRVATYLMTLLHEGGYSPGEATKVIAEIVVARPHLFHLSVETNLKPRIDFLVQTCHLSSKHVATLVKSSSGILGLSVEENFKPTLYYLLQILSQKDDIEGRQALNNVSLSHPPILALSEKNMKQKVDYFDAIDAALSTKTSPGDSLAARIAVRSPVVYSLSLKDNIVPTVEFLAKVSGFYDATSPLEESRICRTNRGSRQANDATLGALLREYPGILTLSLEGNLQPTFNFYNKERDTQSWIDVELVRHKPKVRGRYVAASLFQRLLPRWQYWNEQQSTVKPPLHVIAGSTDVRFCKLLRYDVGEIYSLQRRGVRAASQVFVSFDTWLKTGRAIDI